MLLAYPSEPYHISSQLNDILVNSIVVRVLRYHLVLTRLKRREGIKRPRVGRHRYYNRRDTSFTARLSSALRTRALKKAN